MSTEEIIERIRQLIESADFNGVAAIQDETNDQISLCLRGDEQAIGGAIISLLGTGRIGKHNLSIIAAYCLAIANGFKDFRNPQRFAEHLMNSSQLYAQMQGDKTFS